MKRRPFDENLQELVPQSILQPILNRYILLLFSVTLNIVV